MPGSEQLLELESSAVEQPSPERDTSFTGLLALIASLTILFAAFSSAYIVRRGISNDWIPLPPSALPWVIATVLLLGSVMLEWRRRSGSRRGAHFTIALDIIAGVIVIQSWRVLIATGMSAGASPAAAFFFVFSGGVLACLIGAIAATITAVARRRGMGYTAVYWHYVTALWLWVVMLFKVWP